MAGTLQHTVVSPDVLKNAVVQQQPADHVVGVLGKVGARESGFDGLVYEFIDSSGLEIFLGVLVRHVSVLIYLAF